MEDLYADWADHSQVIAASCLITCGWPLIAVGDVGLLLLFMGFTDC